MANDQGRSGKRGTLTVLFMVAVGVLLALVAVSYWHHVANRAPSALPGEGPAQPPQNAGSVTYDPVAANRAIEGLRKELSIAEAEGRVGDDLQRRAERLVEQYPTSPDAHRVVAEVLMARQDWAGAYTWLVKCLAADNQQPQVHLLAGTVAMKIDRLDEAAGHFRLTVDMIPDDATPRLYLASLYQHMGEHDKALRELLDARLIDTHSPQVYLLIADVYASQRKWPLAVTNIKHAIEYTPAADKQTVSAYNLRLARYLNKWNKPDDALLVLDTLPGKGEKDVFAVEQRAIAHAMKRDNLKAAALFESASGLRGFDGPFMVEAIRQHILAGNRSGATWALERLRERLPEQPEIEGLQMQIDEMGEG